MNTAKVFPSLFSSVFDDLAGIPGLLVEFFVIVELVTGLVRVLLPQRNEAVEDFASFVDLVERQVE